MHNICLDSNLKEVLKNTNKLEGMILIIKADFLWEKTFFFSQWAGEVEGFDIA